MEGVVVRKSYAFIHHRNLLYTGVTHVQRSTIILDDRWSVHNCAGS